MSWMDSWSRPSANSKIPAPLYLSHEDVPYCHSCGRVMSSKKRAVKKQQPAHNIIKYCSDKCRSHKVKPQDRRIEQAIAALLNGEPGSGIEQTAAASKFVKGDRRVIVTMDELEAIVFGSRFDPEKTFGRRKNRRHRAIGWRLGGDEAWTSVDMEDSSPSHHDNEDESVSASSSDNEEAEDYYHDTAHLHEVNGVRVRPPQSQSDVNFSVGGERGKAEKIEESEADREKRLEGAKRAQEREMVRRAARRVIVFGVEVPARPDSKQQNHQHGNRKGKGGKGAAGESDGDGEDGPKEVRKAEALMNGTVVEPSFAKGDWAIRWRE